MWISQAEDTELASLMVRAQAGDGVAYGQLLARVRRVLEGYVRTKLRDTPGADDVLQEVLISLHRARHTYDPARSFAHWLFGICEHRLIDHQRRAVRARRFVAFSPEAIAELAGAQHCNSRALARDAILEAVAQLPAGQRRAVELLKLDGLSVDEAAKRVGVRTAALKVAAHRGYLALKRIMGMESDEH
jgi:RNA polymerase sigma-70 factor, ECF subfamily